MRILLLASAVALLLVGVLACGDVASTTIDSSRTAAEQTVTVDPILFGDNGAGSGPSKVDVDEAVLNFAVPDTWPVLQAPSKPLTEDVIEAISNELGLVAPKVSYGDRTAVAVSNGWQLQFLSLDNSDCLTLLSKAFAEGTFQEGVDTGKLTPVLPTLDEAKEIASAYLQQLGRLDGLQLIDVQSKTEVNSIPTSIAVTYRPLVNGLPVEGPGAKVIVVLGERGEVLAFFYWTTEWQTIGEVILRPIKEAINDLSAGEGSMPPEFWPNIRITDVHLAAYAEPIGPRPWQVKPVYVFTIENADDPLSPAQTWIESAIAH